MAGRERRHAILGWKTFSLKTLYLERNLVWPKSDILGRQQKNSVGEVGEVSGGDNVGAGVVFWRGEVRRTQTWQVREPEKNISHNADTEEPATAHFESAVTQKIKIQKNWILVSADGNT